VKEQIVRLSEEYQLASDYAAFVAVEEARVEGAGEGEKERLEAEEEGDDWLEVELVQAVKEITLSEPRGAPRFTRASRSQTRILTHILCPPPLAPAPRLMSSSWNPPARSRLMAQPTGFSGLSPPPPLPSIEPIATACSMPLARALPPPRVPLPPRAPPPPVPVGNAASFSWVRSGGGRSFGGGGAPMGALRASSAVSFASQEELEEAEEDEEDMGFTLDDDGASNADPALMWQYSAAGSRAKAAPARAPMEMRWESLGSASNKRTESVMRLEPITIALLQDHSGSFSLTEDIVELLAVNRRERGEQGEKLTLAGLKQRIPTALSECADREDMWATLLVAALMMNGMASTRDTWIGMWEKAKEYVVERIGDEDLFMELLEEAEKCL
jgi:hypothetical protein